MWPWHIGLDSESELSCKCIFLHQALNRFSQTAALPGGNLREKLLWRNPVILSFGPPLHVLLILTTSTPPVHAAVSFSSPSAYLLTSLSTSPRYLPNTNHTPPGRSSPVWLRADHSQTIFYFFPAEIVLWQLSFLIESPPWLNFLISCPVE